MVNVVNHEDPTVKYKRKLDEDSLNRLEHDLNDINWEIVMNESNPNLAFSRFMQVLSNTYNDACSVKITTYTGKPKRNDKPSLTIGLNKNKNKLTKLLRLEKKNYYREKLEDCKTNTRGTWKILNKDKVKDNLKQNIPTNFVLVKIE